VKARTVVGGVGVLGGLYVLLVKGALTLDLGVGRVTRPLGPIQRDIAAPPELVFDIIAAPYLGKTPRAMAGKLQVLERGQDMVLADHLTDVGRGLVASTVEVVRFERPSTVSFRLVRGPVPLVTETFALEPIEAGTRFTYTGEMGADFWALGAWWANVVAARWEAAVAESLASITAESERRASRHH
jgi:hypothetical protein